MKKAIMLILIIGLIGLGFVGVQVYIKAKQVTDQIRIGDEHFDNGRYEEAIRAYDQANLIFQRPSTDARIRQAREKLEGEKIDLNQLNLYFPFDSNTLTDHGTGQHRALLQGAVWTSRGRRGGGIQCKGNVDYLLLETKPMKEYTVSIWIKPEGPQGDFARIFDSDNYLDLAVSGPDLALKLNPGDTANDWIETGAQLRINDWNHLVLVSEEAKADLIVNGRHVYRHPSQLPIRLRKLGAHTSDPKNDSFVGLFDEVMIFDTPLPFDKLKMFIERDGQVER